MLKLFYAEVRKADGTSYSKSTLNSLRFALNRHFNATRGFDIINDSQFTDANKVFGAKCVERMQQWLVKVEHKPQIYESTAFGLNYSVKLQNKVVFEVVLFFRRRGRQSIRPVKRTDLSFNMGSTGARCVCKAADELTKNRREDDEGFD